MAERRNFTKKLIDSFPVPNGKRRVYYDTQAKGLLVMVQPTGHKSYGWYRKANGKPRFLSIKPCDEVSLEEARDTAETWNSELREWKRKHFEGPDPFERRQTARPASAPTFEQMVEAYIESHVKETANNPVRAAYDVRQMTNTHFKEWLSKKVDQLSVADMLLVKNNCGEHHVRANRCVEFVRRLFNWSAGRKDGKINFWLVPNPAKDVETYEESSRKRFLQPDELTRFNDTLKNETHRDLKDFLFLAINTGARRSDIFSMRWEDIQWERKVWCVPYPKNGESYDVQLLPVAIAALKRRHSENPSSDVFVFPGPGRTGHLLELKKPWTEFRKRAEIPDVRIHDLRRTVGSYLAISGVPLQQIGAALGQKSLQSTAIYAHLHDEVIREAREIGQAKMVKMMRAARKRTKQLIPPKAKKMLRATSA